MEIKILPNQVITAHRDEMLMDALVRQGLSVQNVCNGKGTCGKCRVRIIERLPSPTERDRKHLNESELSAGIRLACAVVPEQGMTIELDFVDNLDRKEAALLGMKVTTLDPGVEKVFLTLSKPTLADERGDWDRTLDELIKVTGQNLVGSSLKVIGKATEVIRADNYSVTATVTDQEILDLEAGDTRSSLFGAAVDIGTTSVAVALVDLLRGTVLKVVSTENEQTAYGADVISRISFANESKHNAALLQDAIRKTINRLLNELNQATNVSLREIVKMTIVGNTTMHHLFIGLDVAHLAVAPFVSVCNRPLEVLAHELSLDLNPQAKVFLFPNIGSFVGGDTLGAVIGAPEVLEPGNHLLIDLGTNCELFLKTNNTMLACSTAAGPAFEGAGITNGMRARKGAIESIRLSEQGVSSQVIGGQTPIGICGSGLIEGIDEMRRTGVINVQGRIGDPDGISTLVLELQRRIRGTEKGNEFVLAYGSDSGRDITLTQKDIAAFQYAKGAVCAGIKTLVEMAELAVSDLDSVILSGTFATYLKAENILNIGLVPNISPERIKAVGNAAHMGAIRALLDQHQLAFAEDLYGKIRHIELGGSATFSDYFMESMYLERLEEERNDGN
ncbi:ASKHA domain-containing protein [Desulfosporosinus sp. OT]|uniref:ASKHA domain-containing protein n=1 Tax=Desulfosporosinus sp. OT TaxID=913865 RepID=UPI0002239B8C|nr:ASKHA domain-containing protein [Desulfosporosinus sp. OT]EGW38671.1 2Fe-2S iron-sulfur cluster binding domain protein [Desulfosporosinus sp. OT]